MRRLSAKQKKYLDNIRQSREVFGNDDLTFDEFQNLEEMNDFETIVQDIDRYLIDKSFEDAHKRAGI
jgi:hypothetical protein